MTDQEKIQCAGQQCDEREKCLRYRNRGRAPWASFDIERKHFGDRLCVNRVWIVRKVPT